MLISCLGNESQIFEQYFHPSLVFMNVQIVCCLEGLLRFLMGCDKFAFTPNRTVVTSFCADGILLVHVCYIYTRTQNSYYTGELISEVLSIQSAVMTCQECNQKGHFHKHSKSWCRWCPDSAYNFEFSADRQERLSENEKTISLSTQE